MFVVDLIRDPLTSPTQRNNAVMPEIKSDDRTKIFGKLKRYNSAAVMTWACLDLPSAE